MFKLYTIKEFLDELHNDQPQELRITGAYATWAEYIDGKPTRGYGHMPYDEAISIMGKVRILYIHSPHHASPVNLTNVVYHILTVEVDGKRIPPKELTLDFLNTIHVAPEIEVREATPDIMMPLIVTGNDSPQSKLLRILSSGRNTISLAGYFKDDLFKVMHIGGYVSDSVSVITTLSSHDSDGNWCPATKLNPPKDGFKEGQIYQGTELLVGKYLKDVKTPAVKGVCPVCGGVTVPIFNRSWCTNPEKHKETQKKKDKKHQLSNTIRMLASLPTASYSVVAGKYDLKNFITKEAIANISLSVPTGHRTSDVDYAMDCLDNTPKATNGESADLPDLTGRSFNVVNTYKPVRRRMIVIITALGGKIHKDGELVKVSNFGKLMGVELLNDKQQDEVWI